jgi:hypothetical protein
VMAQWGSTVSGSCTARTAPDAHRVVAVGLGVGLGGGFALLVGRGVTGREAAGPEGAEVRTAIGWARNPGGPVAEA